MMKHLLILIGGHLATAPRPQKEAAAAVAAGFRVSIRGTWWDDRLAAEDLELAKIIGADYSPVVDLRQCNPTSRQVTRLRQRIARELFVRLGFVTPRVLGTGAPEMLREAQKLKPDLTMVHSEAGLWVAKQLLREGFRIGVDFEDWFSQDLRPEDRQGRPVNEIQRLERHLLRSAHLTLTTTRVMAEALAEDAQCERVPEVIPNCFPWAGAPKPGEGPRDKRDPEALSLYWFSQTIGPGRGLETLAKALLNLRGKWQLHLRGELRGHRTWFEATFPQSIRGRVVLQTTVFNCTLAAHSSSHDIGLALEESDLQSRDLTATNKIFEYLRCGLGVVATATRGQEEVMASSPGAGWVVPPNDVEALQNVLQSLLDDRSEVATAKVAAGHAAARPWAWERYSIKLQGALLKAGGAEPVGNES